ncbi:MAG: sugar phosphate isomerase/epimerase family protein [Verrucomicrobiota bacterium]
MKRRQFIQNSTLAAAAIGSSSGLLSSVRAGEFTGTIKKAVKYSMVKEPKLSHLDKFKMLKDVGFDGTELRGTDAPNLKEFSKAIEVSGLPVHGVVNGGNPDIAGAIEFSKALGGNTVLVVAVYDKKKPYMESWKGTQEVIRKALPVAEKHQVKILVENVWAGFLISPLDVVRYVDEIDSPWFGSYFDVGNNVRWGVPEHWIELINQRIGGKLDIKEWDEKLHQSKGLRAGFSKELGEGTINWANVRAALKGIHFKGWATAEVRGGDRTRLADIAQRMDKILDL